MGFDVGLRFVRRWLPLLLLGPLVGGAAGYLVVRGIPAVYEATVTLVVQPGDMAVLAPQDLQVAQDLAQTYAEAAHTRRVLTQAAARIGLDGLSARDLDSRVQTRRVVGTQLLRITAGDTEPARAAELANAVAQVFITTNAELQATRYATSRENLTALIDRLQKDIDARQSAINDLGAQPSSPLRDAQLVQLQNALGQMRDTQYNTVRSLEDLRVSEARLSNTATVLDPAVPPDDPIRPNRFSTTVFAAIAGLIVAVASALLAEYLDDRPFDAQRVSRGLALPTLGLLPRGDASVSLRDDTSRQSIETYRVLRSRLAFALADRDARSVLIASAVEGEGKSTVAANLAVALAEAGNRVILVDADIYRPAQIRLFELPNERGLANLLSEDSQDAASVLQGTWVPTLRVLASGPVPADPSALLSSKRVEALLAELGAICDILVIDTPPLLARPDGVLLGPHVDSVLLVVDARRTRVRQAAKALELLRGSGADVLGAVINRANRDSAPYTRDDSPRESATSELARSRPLNEIGLGRRLQSASAKAELLARRAIRWCANQQPEIRVRVRQFVASQLLRLNAIKERRGAELVRVAVPPEHGGEAPGNRSSGQPP
jgi:polysaccharide biosynthesis transport protein